MAWFKAQGHDEHHVVRLRQNDVNRIDVIALAAEKSADVDALCVRVRDSGCRIVHEPRSLTTPGGGYGFSFFHPEGLQFEVSSDVERGAKRDIDRWDGVPVKISHIVLHSPDHKKLVEWFCDTLGFKVSDWLGDFHVLPALQFGTSPHRSSTRAALPQPCRL